MDAHGVDRDGAFGMDGRVAGDGWLIEAGSMAEAMGDPLACVAEHASFERASQVARDLAQRHRDEVVVQRVGDVWRVLCGVQVAQQEYDVYLADVSAMMHALDVAGADGRGDGNAAVDAGPGEDWDGFGMHDESDEMRELAEAL